MIDWSIYRLFVLNRGWKRDSPKNDISICLLDMNLSWTKNAFWDVNKKKWCKWCLFVSLFLFNDTYGLPVITMNTKCPNQVFNVWLVDLQTICANRCWKRDSVQMMIFVNICSLWSQVELKTRFETWITRNVLNGVSLFNLYYLKKLMAYLCSQWIPNVQIKYFMFDCSIYSLFVLNRGSKRDSLQIKLFVYVSSTWKLVELKMRFETWITRNYLNGVRLFHLSYLLTLMAYLCSQRTQNVQINFFMFDWSICGQFVSNTYWKRDSPQMMIFVNICSTWSMVN
jgi:hypothetical protein